MPILCICITSCFYFIFDGLSITWFLRPVKEYFSHFRTIGRWLVRALCNEEPFRFGNFRISLKQVLNPRPRDPKPGALLNHFIYSFFFIHFFQMLALLVLLLMMMKVMVKQICNNTVQLKY